MIQYLKESIAEFIGTFIFLFFLLIVILKISNPKWLIALLVGFSLALGVFVCLILQGPGYLNPLVAILGGSVKDGKSPKFVAMMIAAELFALAGVTLLYITLPYFKKENIKLPQDFTISGLKYA